MTLLYLELLKSTNPPLRGKRTFGELQLLAVSVNLQRWKIWRYLLLNCDYIHVLLGIHKSDSSKIVCFKPYEQIIL